MDLAPILLKQFSLLRSQSLHPAQLTAEFLLYTIQILRPKLWRGQKRNSPAEMLPGAIATFHQYSLRGVPESVNRALVDWYLDKYPLELYFYKPSPEEVLELQVQGKRCVTIFNKLEDWLQLHDGRDAYSFILHDLIHADHFFAKPEWQVGQVEFYKRCLELWQKQEFRKTLEAQPKLLEQFEYAFSDMNSHPEHLNQYLNHLVSLAQ